MVYTITDYTKAKANEINVIVKPSTSKSKKLDVYKDGEKLASVGAIGYEDYPSYIKSRGIEYANRRRALYKIRHENDRHIVWSNGWLADKLLW